MSARHADLERRPVRRSRLVALVAAAGSLVVGALGPSVAAGAEATPQITDVAGDANGINGHALLSALDEGPDTRPASLAHADLREVRFETTYDSHEILDPETGEVTGIDHVATGVNVHIRTEGPIRSAPATQLYPLNYDVQAEIPGCTVRFRLTVLANETSDRAGLWQLSDTCPNGGTGLFGSHAGAASWPQYRGNVTTLSYPFSTPEFAAMLPPGRTLTDPWANAVRTGHYDKPVIVFDRAAVGSSFTIGEDVPADVNCRTEVDPACQA